MWVEITFAYLVGMFTACYVIYKKKEMFDYLYIRVKNDSRIYPKKKLDDKTSEAISKLVKDE